MKFGNEHRNILTKNARRINKEAIFTAMFTVKTPPSFVIVSLILSIEFSSAFNPSAFSGVDVVITENNKRKFNKNIDHTLS